jgi:hypothetical protein
MEHGAKDSYDKLEEVLASVQRHRGLISEGGARTKGIAQC